MYLTSAFKPVNGFPELPIAQTLKTILGANKTACEMNISVF
jgi:hypothetical protein